MCNIPWTRRCQLDSIQVYKIMHKIHRIDKTIMFLQKPISMGTTMYMKRHSKKLIQSDHWNSLTDNIASLHEKCLNVDFANTGVYSGSRYLQSYIYFISCL